MLNLLIGPAGAGKSQYIAARLQPSDVLIDFTALYLALRPHRAGDERADGDPALPLVGHLRRQAVIEAARRELSGWVTSSDGRRAVIRELQRASGVGFAYVLDPGEDTVRRRLRQSQRGRDIACDRAIRRWYDHYEPAASDVPVSENDD